MRSVGSSIQPWLAQLVSTSLPSGSRNDLHSGMVERPLPCEVSAKGILTVIRSLTNWVNCLRKRRSAHPSFFTGRRFCSRQVSLTPAHDTHILNHRHNDSRQEDHGFTHQIAPVSRFCEQPVCPAPRPTGSGIPPFYDDHASGCQATNHRHHHWLYHQQRKRLRRSNLNLRNEPQNVSQRHCRYHNQSAYHQPRHLVHRHLVQRHRHLVHLIPRQSPRRRHPKVVEFPSEKAQAGKDHPLPRPMPRGSNCPWTMMMMMTVQHRSMFSSIKQLLRCRQTLHPHLHYPHHRRPRRCHHCRHHRRHHRQRHHHRQRRRHHRQPRSQSGHRPRQRRLE